MRRRAVARAALLGCLACAAAGGSAGAVGTLTPVPPQGARLTGAFRLAGQITVADNVTGERRGEVVHRTWHFTPGCVTGACEEVTLVRRRAGGTDRLALHLQAPGYYVGYSTYYRGVRCGSGIYRRGERVPFRITVRIMQAFNINGQVIASRINATYRNQVRYNLTPCVAYLGHDAASYHGHVVLPPTP